MRRVFHLQALDAVSVDFIWLFKADRLHIFLDFVLEDELLTSSKWNLAA